MFGLGLVKLVMISILECDTWWIFFVWSPSTVEGYIQDKQGSLKLFLFWQGGKCLFLTTSVFGGFGIVFFLGLPS